MEVSRSLADEMPVLLERVRQGGSGIAFQCTLASATQALERALSRERALKRMAI
jgi:hypothetical protein